MSQQKQSKTYANGSNDVSFSIPNWKLQEIKGFTFEQEELMYITSPYNLNDFKNDHSSDAYQIFLPTFDSQESLLFHHPEFEISKKVNNIQDASIALFLLFLSEILRKNAEEEKQRWREKNIVITKKQPSLTEFCLSNFKQKIYELDLCSCCGIPEQFKKYYKQEIIKKILFQFLSKCVHNVSLIQILPMSNAMLRFAITLITKSLLLKENKIYSYSDELQDCSISFKVFFNYFVSPINEKMETGAQQFIVGEHFVRFKSTILAAGVEETLYLLIRKENHRYPPHSETKLTHNHRIHPQIVKVQAKSTSQQVIENKMESRSGCLRYFSCFGQK